jgi:hypothetical protein
MKPALSMRTIIQLALLSELRMCLTNSVASESRREEFGATTTTIPENHSTELIGYSGLFSLHSKAELLEVHA